MNGNEGLSASDVALLTGNGNNLFYSVSCKWSPSTTSCKHFNCGRE